MQDELSVDAWHTNGKNLYAVVERLYYDHKITGQYNVPAVLVAQMKKALPEVEYATRMENDDDNTFQVGDKILKKNGAFADSDIFRIFSYKLLEGNAQTALNSPSAIAISRKMAEDFYGSPQAASARTSGTRTSRTLKSLPFTKTYPKIRPSNLITF